MATTRRLARKNDSRYFLQFAATASLLVAGTLALVLLVLPKRYVLSSGFREGNLALPDPSVPFEPPDPVVIAALPPLPAPSEVVRGPAEILWEQVLPLLAREEFEGAIPMFAAYLELYPGDLDVRREYAITLLRAGYADRAIPVLESLLPAQNDRELRLLLARTLRDVGNVSGAAALYDALLRATPDELAKAFLFLFFAAVVKAVHRLEIEALAFGEFLALQRFLGFGDELLGPLLIIDVGHGQAPVSHGASGIEKEDVAEGPLGLEVPEPVQLADALIEECLDIFPFGRDGKGDLARVLHEIGLLPGALVEGLSVIGMAGREGLGLVSGRIFLPQGGSETENETDRGQDEGADERVADHHG